MGITTRDLASLAKQKGKWKSESLAHGHGSLALRCLADGIGIYYRYHDGGKLVNLPIGRYDETGAAGLTLKQARAKAGELSATHAKGVTAVREQEAAKAREANAALRQATTGTFGQLLDAYAHGLEMDGKVSWRTVRNMLKKWVTGAHPDLPPRRASEITRDDIMRILVKPTEAGLTRTVNQLRSYLLAALNRAINAAGDPSLAATIGTGYNLSFNPVTMTKPVRKFENARSRVLTDDELRDYLAAVDSLPPVTAAVLKLGLYLGGQRPQQLLRVQPDDVDLRAGTVRLLDGKGRRAQPRVHVLPLTALAAELFQTLIQLNSAAPSLFSNDGHTIMDIDTVSHRVAEISQGRYQMRDIRRTVETRLARMGISKDLRAQIQSHGLSGIQDKHYDQHDYMEEKRAALESWALALQRIVDGREESNVVLLRATA
jgi:integrase